RAAACLSVRVWVGERPAAPPFRGSWLMSIQVRCPNPECGLMLGVPDDSVGRAARCRRCGTRFTVTPSSGGPPGCPSPPGVAVAAPPQVVGRYRIRLELGAGAFGT